MKFLALLAIFILVPHTKVPGGEFVYPFRPSDLIIIVATVAALPWIATHHPRRGAATVPLMLLYFTIAIASTCWGYYLLSSENLARMIDDGTNVEYLTFAIKKLFLIAICFCGFQYVTSDRAVSNASLLKFWYRGLAIAVALHLLFYVVSANYFMQRAGVFVEGNHGGSYYLLSFFLMWTAQQEGLRFGRYGMAIAFLGIMLSQSTTSLLVLIFLSMLAYFLMPSKLEVRKKFIGPAFSGLIVLVLISTLYGDTIMSKLIGEDLDSNTFSRYDRISSIVSGVNMFLEHPIFGVGIQGYAFALPKYADPFIESFFDWNSRRIANNIYVEILAEQGSIGIIAFFALIYRICAPAFRQIRQHAVPCAALASILFSWLAFPTYTVSFHWIGMALIYRLTVYGGAAQHRHYIQLKHKQNAQDIRPGQFTLE